MHLQLCVPYISGMNFDLNDAANLLSRTPGTLYALLRGLPEPWLHATEGEGTWNPLQVVAHLIHADQTNWLPRARAILEGDGTFPPFDRFAHLSLDHNQAVDTLLDEFATIRAESIRTLQTLNPAPDDLRRLGQHPEFGPVTLAQLLSTWVVHDLDHMVQISRTLAGNYREAVGPWRAYLRVMN